MLTYTTEKLEDGRYRANFVDMLPGGLEITFTLTDTTKLRLELRATAVVTDAAHDVVVRRLNKKPVQGVLPCLI